MLDQALDAAERGRPLPQAHMRGRGDRRRLAARHADREHGAEALLHLPRGDRMARILGKTRKEHLHDMGMRPEAAGEIAGAGGLRGGAQGEGAQRAHQQIGLERPEDRAAARPDRGDPDPGGIQRGGGERRRRSRRNGRSGSWCPNASTMSAPSVSGRVWNGEATVESTASRAPAAWAISAAAAMSVTVQSGLPGVSIQTSLVRPGRIAARSASRSSMATKSRSSRPSRRLLAQPALERPVHHRRRDHVVARLEGAEHGGRRRHAGAEQHGAGRLLQHRQHGLRPRARSRCRAGHRRSRRNSRCRDRG